MKREDQAPPTISKALLALATCTFTAVASYSHRLFDGREQLRLDRLTRGGNGRISVWRRR